MKISTRPLKLLPLLLVLGLAAAVWYWRRMERAIGVTMLLVAAYIGWLVLESYATHGQWMAHMHVFSKVITLFVVYGTYGYYYRRGLPPFGVLAGIMYAMLFLNLLLVHPEALSLQAFLDTERGFSAGAALMLVLPTLLCLNWYLQRGNLLLLGLFFVSLALIVFLQHRSVWLTMLVALPLNVLLLWWRVPSARFSPQRLVLLVVLPVALAGVGGLATILQNPAITKKFVGNYEDITHADKQGTGNWRFQQMQAYAPLVAERPLLGWRQEGFDLPMQFFDPASDQPMWPDGTGHHFHSFYMDRLFYFGWLGLLLVVVLPFAQVIRRLAHPAPLTAESAALVGLAAGCIVFGLSYDWPTYIYAFQGLMLATMALPAPVAAPQPTAQRRPLAAQPVFAT
ncbi:MAG: hypothetical protein EOO59_01615 [Hymenobacter sp.]|nr:MAG: hypothetical protein EOO59_01615 [Hymenobacter sp.]